MSETALTSLFYRGQNSFKRRMMRILHYLGIRRHVLWIDNCNWSEMDWPAVFTAHPTLRYVYRLASITLPEIKALASHPFSEEVTPTNIQALHHRGLNLWELSKSGILASLAVPCLPGQPDERTLRVVSFFYQEVARVIDGAEELLSQAKPQSLILTQGCTPMARPIVEVARRHHINVVAVEGSFLRNFVFCDNATGMIVNRHGLSRLAGDWLPAQAITSEERQAFRERFQKEQQQKRPEHQTGSEDVESVRAKLGIPADKKVAVFLGQVLTDASQIMDGKAISDPVELIHQVQTIFKAHYPDWCLVVRLHPKEVNGVSWVNHNDPEAGIGAPPGEPEGPLPYNQATWRRMQERGLTEEAGRFIVVRDTSINTARLVEEAAVGITVNSQAGFEMALTYKPVVVCGDAFFAGKGFTWDVGHPSGLASIIHNAINSNGLDEQQQLAVDRFGNSLLRDFLYPRSLQGAWSRFFRLIDGGAPSPVRGHFLRKVEIALASHHTPFGTVENYLVGEPVQDSATPNTSQKKGGKR